MMSHATTRDRLETLVATLEANPAYAAVTAALGEGKEASVDGAWGSSCALATALLARAAPEPVLVVIPFLDELESWAAELSLFTDRPIETFPGWDVPPDAKSPTDEIFGDRLRVLKLLSSPGEPPPIIVAGIQSLLEPVPSLELLSHCTRRLQVGDELDLDELLSWLLEHGLRQMTAVELPGEFTLHGGILDLFAPDWYDPVRIELFGDQIESLRTFRVDTQRSLATVDSVDLTLLLPESDTPTPMTEHLPPGSWIVLHEPRELEQCGRKWLRQLDKRRGLYTVESTLKRALEFPHATMTQLPGEAWETSWTLRTESVERFHTQPGALAAELERTSERDQVWVVCRDEHEQEQLQQILAETAPQTSERLNWLTGNLRTGFRLIDQQVTILSAAEMVGRKQAARGNKRHLGRAIDSFLDLREGDYVVHLSHGIGRYWGLRLLETDRHREEHLELEFDGGTKIFVPTSKIDLVQKYVGAAKSRPKLSKIGGRMWARRKTLAQEAVIDMASDLLDVTAARQSQIGIAYPEDSLWQKQFEEAFPYNETPDQLTAIEAIRGDMQSPRSMDRLICGEVGYGKTELAMRAAFKAIDNGYQVAILVPTTILAEQHFRTFTERMRDFPFQIGVLSRFRTKAQQQELIEGLAAGSVDLVIGTHRLVQQDVQFANLGLVVIDEEQRFGVEVKERLKLLRRVVDVLTLTATPIPRTLHLSLLGIRDISNLETPPEDRLAVETRVSGWDPELIRYAVRRELDRGGQVFFVHNRIHDIQKVAQRLREIVPEASLVIGHGQMPEDKLNRVMLDFVDGKYDILLATTIVESGLDIPNANTLFVDEADRYGLAELHQLRGRVGRYKHRAYCYLLLDRSKTLNSTAAKRLKAIEEFSSIGAGFAIAMRDLEIRGAGNILGTQQSGHIAAVGYELYCRLLDEAVRKLKDLPAQERVAVNLDLPGQSMLPRSYIPDMRLKIDLYRRLGRVVNETELNDLVAEMADRFGPPPEEVVRMLDHARLRIWAHGWQVASIHLDGDHAALEYRDRNLIAELVLRSQGRLRVVDHRHAYLPLVENQRHPDEILEQLNSLLRPRLN